MSNLPRIVSRLTYIAHDALSHFVSEDKLYNWKPVHLCWWYEKNQYPIPKYFIGKTVVPTVTTQACSGTGDNQTTGNATITATGGENAGTRGFCYMPGAAGDPTVANSKAFATGSFGTGAFTQTIGTLTAGTDYRVRGYAYNSAGVGYGTTVAVKTTGSPPAPSVVMRDLLNPHFIPGYR